MRKKLLVCALAAGAAMLLCGGLAACGKEKTPEPHEHVFLEYVYNSDATCTKDGTETAKCRKCGQPDTRVRAGTALGHDFQEYVSDGNVTCTEDGTETALCTRCGAKDVRTKPAGHSLSLQKGTASCTEDGTLDHYRCDRCKALFADEDGTVPLTAPPQGRALGHAFDVSNRCARCGEAWAFTDGLEYEYDEYEQTYTVTGSGGVTGKVTIPYGYRNRPVVAIGRSAFDGCRLTEISIPSTVLSVGAYAFAYCYDLCAVRVPDLEAWMHIDFDGTSANTNPLSYAHTLYVNGRELTELTIPEGIEEIKPYAFTGWGGLRSLDLSGVVSVGRGAFSHCEKLEELTLGGNLRTVEQGAFDGCSVLSRVTVGENVETIGDRAFTDCKGLAEVWDFSAALDIVAGDSGNGGVAKYAMRVYTENTPSRQTEKDGFLFFEDGDAILLGCRGEETALVLPAFSPNGNPYSIRDDAFTGRKDLLALTLGEGVTGIGSGTFSGCTSLKTVVWNAALRKIGAEAFYGCSKLGGTQRWENLTELGARAFYGCGKLGSVEIAGEGLGVGDYAFTSCGELKSAKLGAGVTTVGTNAFSACTLLEEVTLGDDVARIGRNAFANCTALRAVTFGRGITAIEPAAFQSCTALKTVDVPDIGVWCGITFQSTDANPVYFAKKLYSGGVEVVDLVIPEGVKEIRVRAFYNAEGLRSVKIPASVKKCSTEAFYGCHGLEKVYIDDIAAWCRTLFELTWANPLTFAKRLYSADGTEIADLTVPAEITELGQYVFHGCESLKVLRLHENMTSIGKEAFSGCSNLEYCEAADGNPVYASADGILYNKEKTAFVLVPSALKGDVTIPEGIEEIAENFGSPQLTSITLPVNLKKITRSAAFRGCETLTAVHISDLAAWCAVEFADQEANPLFFAEHLYLNGDEVTELKDLAGIGEIKASAFTHCLGLVRADLNGVTAVGNYAFDGCTALSGLSFGETAVSIGNYAFRGCASLGGKLTLPASVTAVGDYSFSGTEIASVEFGGAAAIGQWAFSACTALTDANLGNAVSLGRTAFTGSALKKIVIPDSVQEIGISVFWGCAQLESVTLGRGLKSIPATTFYQCTALTEITIPSNITEIGDGAFSGCDALERAVFETPEGWGTLEKQLDLRIPFSAEILRDPAAAAKYLTQSFTFNVWTRE